MRNLRLALLAVLPLATLAVPSALAADQGAAASDAIAAAVAAPTRSDANKARDKYRNPAGTLAFFGVKPEHTVVEIWPGGGWYTEILAPMTKGKGTLYAAAGTERGLNGIRKLMEADAATYGHVKLASFPAETALATVPAGSADVVLTFRNVHNWRFGGADATQAAFNQIFQMLKPGGVLGVVEHRLPEGKDSAMEEKSGYMKKSSVVAFAEKAGFRLADESDINANPRDTHDYPKGVWTLPPRFAEGDVDREKYAAIGESDRMTLKFVKPAE